MDDSIPTLPSTPSDDGSNDPSASDTAQIQNETAAQKDTPALTLIRQLHDEAIAIRAAMPAMFDKALLPSLNAGFQFTSASLTAASASVSLTGIERLQSNGVVIDEWQKRWMTGLSGAPLFNLSHIDTAHQQFTSIINENSLPNLPTVDSLNSSFWGPNQLTNVLNGVGGIAAMMQPAQDRITAALRSFDQMSLQVGEVMKSFAPPNKYFFEEAVKPLAQMGAYVGQALEAIKLGHVFDATTKFPSHLFGSDAFKIGTAPISLSGFNTLQLSPSTLAFDPKIGLKLVQPNTIDSLRFGVGWSSIDHFGKPFLHSPYQDKSEINHPTDVAHHGLIGKIRSFVLGCVESEHRSAHLVARLSQLRYEVYPIGQAMLEISVNGLPIACITQSDELTSIHRKRPKPGTPEALLLIAAECLHFLAELGAMLAREFGTRNFVEANDERNTISKSESTQTESFADIYELINELVEEIKDPQKKGKNFLFITQSVGLIGNIAEEIIAFGRESSLIVEKEEPLAFKNGSLAERMSVNFLIQENKHTIGFVFIYERNGYVNTLFDAWLGKANFGRMLPMMTAWAEAVDATIILFEPKQAEYDFLEFKGKLVQQSTPSAKKQFARASAGRRQEDHNARLIDLLNAGDPLATAWKKVCSEFGFNPYDRKGREAARSAANRHKNKSRTK